MAGVIGLRGPDIAHRTRLLDFHVAWHDTDRPMVRPGTGLPVLHHDDGYHATRHVFGFTRRFSSFNARDDRLEDSRLWTRFFGKHHGIAPVSYILEWADLGDGQGKRPFRVERSDGMPMACPSLVGPSLDEPGTPAFALCTTTPGPFFARLHARTICDCPDALLARWLHPEDEPPSRLLACLQPPDNDLLQAVPLAPGLGRAAHDDTAPLQDAGPPMTAATLPRGSKQMRLE